LRFEGNRYSRIAQDIPDFAVLGKVTGEQLVPVQPDPDEGHLRTPVGIECDKMSGAA
jgi:hypothetical protein